MTSKTVTILLAIYNPNIEWLKLQLLSLNNQTYADLDLITIDDYSTTIAFTDLQVIFQQYLSNIPYTLIQNSQNIGSNATFEKLTSLADSKYIALCDQDDIWHNEKIATLVDYANNENATLCYSDYEIIDGNSQILSNSAKEYYKRYKMLDGANLAPYFLTKNFIPGCIAIFRSDIAKASIPFVQNMVHDHWLALNAAIYGNITLIDKPLVSYRIHETNQTGVLKGIENKSDYIALRVATEQKRFFELSERLNTAPPEIIKDIKNLLEWTNARLKYFEGTFSCVFTIIKHMQYNLYLSLFDIFVMKFPECLFKKVVKLIVNRYI